MIFSKLFHHSRRNEAAQALYGQVVSQARCLVFYTRFGVADTIDGRFDMIVLHAFLLLHRLGLEQGSTNLAQALFDVMFGDMDHNLREMGVSDLHVKGKIRDMVRAFYGRVAVYDAALAAPDDLLLVEALRRNVYRQGTEPSPDSLNALVAYIREIVYILRLQSIRYIQAGRVSFGPPSLKTSAGKRGMRDIPPNIAEFSRPLVVESLSPGRTVMRIAADPGERAALAHRFGLLALKRLEAEVYLRPMADAIVWVEGHFQADVVQSCVVTLEPITVTVAETFVLTYKPSPEPSSIPGEGQVEIAVAAGDPPDPMIDGIIDVGEAVAEHLALALDPFPRKPMGEFHYPQESDGELSSPFSALVVLQPNRKD